MNILDIAIVIIVVLLIIRGFSRGIVQEAATLMGLIASFLLASFYYQELSLLLERFTPNHKIILSFFCFVFLFIFGLFLFNFLGMLAKKAIRLTLLGWVDRTLGGLFGLIKGAVIIFILVTILTVFYPKSAPLVENSRFFPTSLAITERLTLLIPYKIKDNFLAKKKNLQNFWEERKKNIKNLQKLSNE